MKLSQPVLVLIDIQRGFGDPSWGERNDSGFEDNVARLLAAWRERKLPLVHVQHVSEEPGSPLRGGQPGCDFMEVATPREGEMVLQKKVNSALIGTPLEYWLRRWSASEVILAGISTDHCVSTTARMGANLGLPMVVVSDATYAFARKLPDGRTFDARSVHEVSLASLSGEFAAIHTTQAVVRCALKHHDASDPRFPCASGSAS